MFGPSFPGGPPPMGPPGGLGGFGPPYPLDPFTYKDPKTGKIYTVESTLEPDGSINRLVINQNGQVVGGWNTR